MRMERMQQRILYVAVLFAVILAAWATHPPLELDARETTALQAVQSPVQVERDEIYTLLAYAVVLKDWQTVKTEPRRGHNIGSVLVDTDGNVVSWARNCNMITGNGTQHGEVRLMTNYLAKVRTYSLEDYVVYTSLEPCAMCSGMMVLQKMGRTVYGQTDPGFGKALERLALDSRALPNGYKPYPRAVVSEMSPSIIRQALDKAYSEEKLSLTNWLLSDTARKIYEDALNRFLKFKPRYPENDPIIKKAIAFYKTVPDSYVPPENK